MSARLRRITGLTAARWPLTSKGVHYNGKPVDGDGLGIDYDLADLEQPIVDLTPGIAVSSFVVYDGDAFPEWRGQLLVGSLGTMLFRSFSDDGHDRSDVQRAQLCMQHLRLCLQRKSLQNLKCILFEIAPRTC